MVTFVNFVYNL